MRIDEKLIKVSLSKIPVDQEFNLGDDVTVVVRGVVTKLAHEDNQGGSYDEVYTVKGIVAEAVKD